MIEIKTDIRKDLYDLDNISNLLNYAVNATINKHYKDKATTDEEKKNIAQQLIVNYLNGNKRIISNTPCPINYPEDITNGINGMRDLLNSIDIKNIRYSILNENVLSHAYTEFGLKKIGGYNTDESIAKYVTDVSYSGKLDENIDSLFENQDFLNGMVSNYLNMSYTNDFSFHSTVVSLAYSNEITKSSLEQINSEQNKEIEKHL